MNISGLSCFLFILLTLNNCFLLATPSSAATTKDGETTSFQPLEQKDVEKVPEGKKKKTPPKLTDAEQKDMLFMYEEERLLRDICTELNRSSTLPMINNMRKISDNRMKILKKQMNNRKAGVKFVDRKPGDFDENPAHKKKYRKALQLGKLSRLNALRIICGMKEEQIQHYTRLAGQTDKPGLKKLYRQFVIGSENQMRNLYKRIGKEGANYNPQYMGRNDFLHIINRR